MHGGNGENIFLLPGHSKKRRCILLSLSVRLASGCCGPNVGRLSLQLATPKQSKYIYIYIHTQYYIGDNRLCAGDFEITFAPTLAQKSYYALTVRL